MTDGSSEARRDSWTYVLVTPDGLILQPLSSIVGVLRRHGLEPRAGRLLRLDAATLLRMYDRSVRDQPLRLPPPGIFELWYSLGPACVLLLHRGEGDACAAMLDLKGATDPTCAGAGSLRHAGENALMNLVHCPDDASAADWELAQLLGENDASAMRRAAALADDQIRLLTVDSLGHALPACSGREALSVPLIVNKLRLRFVQRMALRSHRHASALAMLTEARQELERERDALLRVDTSAGRLSVARSHDADIHDRLHEVSARCGEPAWTNAVRELSASIGGSSKRRPDVPAAMAASGIPTSHMEDVALTVNAYAL